MKPSELSKKGVPYGSELNKPVLERVACRFIQACIKNDDTWKPIRWTDYYNLSTSLPEGKDEFHLDQLVIAGYLLKDSFGYYAISPRFETLWDKKDPSIIYPMINASVYQ